MKKTLLFVILFFHHVCNAQCSESLSSCEQMLQGGLYAFTGMTNTGSFSQDIRTYFLSDQFKKDWKNKKWGSSLTIPIKGVPFTLDANSSEEKFNEFSSKIISETSLNITSDFFQTTFSSIPNTNLYDSFNECIRTICTSNQIGFLPVQEVVTDDYVVFTIYYRPQIVNDPLPKVQYFNVENVESIRNGLKPGDTMFQTTIISVKRIPEKDIILTLQTDRGTVSRKIDAEKSLSSDKEVPIGTVIASFLTFKEFSFVSKSNLKSPGEIWTSEKSKWSPCDGRNINGSSYAKIASKSIVPDLRGMFLRGLNNFDPDKGPALRSLSERDPENRVVGDPQMDLVGPHGHGWTGIVGNGNPHSPLDYVPEDPTNRIDAYVRQPHKNYSEYGVGAETRPKNVAVYYYIKIN